jgi:hypothetical protein
LIFASRSQPEAVLPKILEIDFLFYFLLSSDVQGLGNSSALSGLGTFRPEPNLSETTTKTAAALCTLLGQDRINQYRTHIRHNESYQSRASKWPSCTRPQNQLNPPCRISSDSTTAATCLICTLLLTNAWTIASKMQTAVVVSAVRTPIGSFGGSLAGVTGPRLGAACITAALQRTQGRTYPNPASHSVYAVIGLNLNI